MVYIGFNHRGYRHIWSEHALCSTELFFIDMCHVASYSIANVLRNMNVLNVRHLPIQNSLSEGASPLCLLCLVISNFSDLISAVKTLRDSICKRLTDSTLFDIHHTQNTAGPRHTSHHEASNSISNRVPWSPFPPFYRCLNSSCSSRYHSEHCRYPSQWAWVQEAGELHQASRKVEEPNSSWHHLHSGVIPPRTRLQ